MNDGFARLGAYLLSVLGVFLVLGLLVAGFVAALVLVPIGVVAFLVLRHGMRTRMTTTAGEVWTGAESRRRPADIEGVVLDVKVERPDAPPGMH